jgi:hypothetical protein
MRKTVVLLLGVTMTGAAAAQGTRVPIAHAVSISLTEAAGETPSEVVQRTVVIPGSTQASPRRVQLPGTAWRCASWRVQRHDMTVASCIYGTTSAQVGIASFGCERSEATLHDGAQAWSLELACPE